MILSKMLPPSASALNLKLCFHRSSLGFDLVPIARFQMIRAASIMSVSPVRRISMSMASNSGTSFSSSFTQGEVEVSERLRFEKCAMITESRGELMMEEEESEGFEVEFVEAKAPDVLIGGGDGSSGGGGGGENWFGDGYYGESGRQIGNLDEYYQKMIETYPGHALILSNYARFLKEVKGDAAKAEEYCERAILAKPNDGNALSLYGDLIWQTHRDGDRAQTYFDQAVNSAPNDCNVLASYAKFLWDAGDEDNESEEDEVEITKSNTQSFRPIWNQQTSKIY